MKTTLALICTVLLSASSAFAAPDPAATSVLTIRQAVDRALGTNPSVVQAREKVQEQKSFHSAGISALFPRLNGTLRGERRKDSVLTGLAAFNGEAYNQYEASLQLVQPIYNGGGLWSGLTSLSRARAVSDLDLKIAERDTTVDVISAYYSVLMNQEKLAALKSNRKIQDESLGVAKHRASIGRGQTLDVLEMKTQIALLDAKIAQTEADLKTSVVGLMLLFADRTTTSVDLKGSLRPKGLREFLAKTKDRPYEIYEFSRIAAVRDQTEATNKTTLAKYWPQLNFVGNYGRVSNTRADLTNDFANAWSYGLELTIPIFSGLSSVAEGNAYASQLKQIEIQEARVKDAAAFAETKALHDLQAAESTIQTSADALSLADQAMKEAARNYRYSTIDYLRYLSIQQSLLDTQVAYQTAALTYITSIAHYLVATGHDVGELVGVLEGTP